MSESEASWMLDRASVRAFVARERTDLDARVASGELMEQVSLDQRDAFLDLLCKLPAEQLTQASNLYLEEKKALYEGRARKAEAQTTASEASLEAAVAESAHTFGAVIAAAVVIFVFLGAIYLARGY